MRAKSRLWIPHGNQLADGCGNEQRHQLCYHHAKLIRIACLASERHLIDQTLEGLNLIGLVLSSRQQVTLVLEELS